GRRNTCFQNNRATVENADSSIHRIDDIGRQHDTCLTAGIRCSLTEQASGRGPRQSYSQSFDRWYGSVPHNRTADHNEDRMSRRPHVQPHIIYIHMNLRFDNVDIHFQFDVRMVERYTNGGADLTEPAID